MFFSVGKAIVFIAVVIFCLVYQLFDIGDFPFNFVRVSYNFV